MKKLFILATTVFVSFLFIVSCDKQGEPRLNITTGTQVFANAEDSVVSFNFEIVNGVEDGQVILYNESADWITGYEILEYEVSGVINLSLLENTTIENRSEVITIGYQYGSTVIMGYINVVQMTRQYDYDYTAEIAMCHYWGQDPELLLYAYDIYFGQGDLTMETQGEAYYALEFLTSETTEDFLPQEGVYTVAYPGEETDFSISAIYSIFMSVGDAAEDEDYDVTAYFAKGEITVERDGDIFTISGYLTDRQYYNHRVYYQGELKARNRTVESTLTEDVNMDITGAKLQAYFYGDNFENGTNVWTMSLAKEDLQPGTPVIQIQLSTDVTVDCETGFATQTFVYDADNTLLSGTFYKGYQTDMYSGSWYYTSAGVNEGVLYVQDPVAPFRGGEIHFERNDDGTLNIDIDVVDDANHSIRAVGTNIVVEYYDFTAFASSTMAMTAVRSNEPRILRK